MGEPPRIDGIIAIDPAARIHNGICALTKRADDTICIPFLNVTDALGGDPRKVSGDQLRAAFAACRALGCRNIVVLIEDQSMCNSQRQTPFVEKHLHEVCEEERALHISVSFTQKDIAIERITGAKVPTGTRRKPNIRNAIECFVEVYTEKYGPIFGWNLAQARSGQRDMADAMAIALADSDVITHAPQLLGQGSPLARQQSSRPVVNQLAEAHIRSLSHGVYGHIPTPVWKEFWQRRHMPGPCMGRGWSKGASKAYWLGHHAAPVAERPPRRDKAVKSKPGAGVAAKVTKQKARTPAKPLAAAVAVNMEPMLPQLMAALRRRNAAQTGVIDLTSD